MPAPPAAAPFVFSDRVRFADLDARGHLNNVAFLALMEAARQAFLRELDPGYDPTRPQARDLILAHTEIDYRAQAGWEDDVVVELVPEDVDDNTFRLAFVMRVDDHLVAEGSAVLVGYDYEAQETTALPHGLRAKLDAQRG